MPAHTPVDIEATVSRVEKMQYAQMLTEGTLDTLGIAGWTVGFNSDKTKAGKANFTHKTIEYSTFALPLMTQAEIKETVFHEVGHVLAPKDGHGARWKAAVRMLGGNPARTRTINIPKQDIYDVYAVVCSCPQGHKGGFHRLPQRVSFCGICIREGLRAGDQTFLSYEKKRRPVPLTSMPARYQQEVQELRARGTLS